MCVLVTPVLSCEIRLLCLCGWGSSLRQDALDSLVRQFVAALLDVHSLFHAKTATGIANRIGNVRELAKLVRRGSYKGRDGDVCLSSPSDIGHSRQRV
jgi:hypothetical protein